MRNWRLFIMICIAALISLSAGCAVTMGDKPAQDETVTQIPTDSGNSPFSVPDDGASAGDDSADDSTVVDTDDTDDETPPAADDAVEIVTKDSDIDKEVSEGGEYSQLFEVKGGSGDYAWTLEGELPAGLDLVPVGDRESITGTLEAGSEGEYPLTLTVKDAEDPANSDSISFTLKVLKADDSTPVILVPLTPVLTTSGISMKLIKFGAPGEEGYDADVLADIAAGTETAVGLDCEINTEMVFAVSGVDASASVSWELVDTVSYPQSFKDLMEEIEAPEDPYLTENNTWFNTKDYVLTGISWDAEKAELHAIGNFCGYNSYGAYLWDYLAELLEEDPDANIYLGYQSTINPTETLTITLKSGEDTASATIKFLVKVTMALDDIVEGIHETQQNDQIPVSSDDVPGNAPNLP